MFQSPLSWPQGWPVTPWNQRRADSCFQCTPGRAVDDLYDELRKLYARDVLIISNLPLGMKGNALLDTSRNTVREPGVALYFTRDQKPYCLAQDAFGTIFGNLRSIGLAVKALRQMERHGGARLTQRAFSGFTALPPPRPPVSWREILGPGTREQVEARYRELARQAHPDFGGTVEKMAELNAAITAARRDFSEGSVR